MSYVYIKSQPGLWTVGTYDGGSFEPDSDHTDEDNAARRAAWLNGAPADHHLLVEERDDLRAQVERRRGMTPAGLIDFASWVFIIGAVIGSTIQRATGFVPFWVLVLISLANIIAARLAIGWYVRSRTGGEQS
jgi:hypothetical protein